MKRLGISAARRFRAAAAALAVLAALALAVGIGVGIAILGGAAPAAVPAAAASGDGMAGVSQPAAPADDDGPLRPASHGHWRDISSSPSFRDVREGSTTRYAIYLEGTAPTGNVTVAITSNNDDVTVNPTSLTFTPANYGTRQDVVATIAHDDDWDNENAVLTHTASGGGFGGIYERVRLTITDDEKPELRFGVGVEGFTWSMTETSPRDLHSYPLMLLRQPRGNVTVSITSSDPGAVTVSPSSMTFTRANWNTSQQVTIRAVQDADRNNESVTIRHAASGGGYDGVTKDIPVTVSDGTAATVVSGAAITLNPTEMTIAEGASKDYTVRLAALPTGNVTVTITVNGIVVSPESLTFTTSNWSTAQTVAARASPDQDLEDDDITIAHNASGGGYDSISASLPVRVTDPDVGALAFNNAPLAVREGSSGNYFVRLAKRPTGDVAVSIASNNGDVTAAPDALTFTPRNWDERQRVRVSAAQDDDAANETAVLTHTASGGGYDSVTARVTVSVTDNDEPAITPTPTAAPTRAPTPTPTVVPTRRPAPTPTPVPTATPAPEPTPPPIGAFPAIDVTPQQVSVAEGGTAGYTVTLATAPTGNVTVAITVGGDGADLVSVDPARLTFGVGNWGTEQRVTIRAGDDDKMGDAAATLSHRASGGGYGEADVATVAVRILDNDGAGVSFNAERLSVPENAYGVYTVALARRPAAPVTIAIAAAVSVSGGGVNVGESDNGGDGGVILLPDRLTFTAGDWSTPQSVIVLAGADGDVINSAGVLTHTPGGGEFAAVSLPLELPDAGIGFDPTAVSTTYEVNGHTVTRIHAASAPAGARVYVPSNLDGANTIGIAPRPDYAPLTDRRYGLGAAASITMRTAPAGGAVICLPASDALRTTAGSGNPLRLLRYTDSGWTPVAAGAYDLGTQLCAAGITAFAPFAVGYALPLGPATELQAAAGSRAGTIRLTWTPGTSATRHWVAGISAANLEARNFTLAAWERADGISAHTVSGLDSGVEYIFTIAAGRIVNGAGEWSSWSAWARATPD